MSETEWENGRAEDKNDDRADKRDWKGIQVDAGKNIVACEV